MEFLANNLPTTKIPKSGEVLVDIIRKNLGLCGTTVACREGDCGACTVLVGRVDAAGKLVYRPLTSCISPAGNAQGSHVVTIEGLSTKGINPLQELLCSYSGTQCGFCTPGFIVSLTGFLLNSASLSYEDAIAAIDGNICRCTGYKSIERAIKQLISDYGPKLKQAPSRLQALIDEGFLPPYFADLSAKLAQLQGASSEPRGANRSRVRPHVGGGSDLYVQQPEKMRKLPIKLLYKEVHLKGISREGSLLRIGAATSIEEFCEHPELRAIFPCLSDLKKLFASTQIRNQGSIGGNIINASPIGDISNFLLALDAHLVLVGPLGQRLVAQKDFYLGYKTIDKSVEEHLAGIVLQIPTAKKSVTNFEKVSRRTHLDIASVNSAALFVFDHLTITSAQISAGGVAPTPLRLSKLETWLQGRSIDAPTAQEAARRAMEEITPISDVRGSATYKKLLLSKLILAHFLRCFPERLSEKDLLA